MNKNMKQTTKNANTAGKKTAAACIAILTVAALLVSLLFAGCGDSKKDKATPDSASSQTVSEAADFDDKETFDIDLGFVNLKYPVKWQKDLVLKGDGKHQADESFTLSFLLGNQPVFDLIFNGVEGELLGTIRGEKNTTLRVVTHKVDIASAKGEMQEDINVILTNLKKDYDFVSGEIDADDDSVFEIKTDLTTFYYPAKWKDMVTVETEEKKVSFLDGDTPLFDLCFEETEGYLAGTYDGTPIYIVDYQAKTDEQAMMQEDINVILQYLRQDDKFIEG